MKIQKSVCISYIALIVVVIIAITVIISLDLQLKTSRLNINSSASQFDSKFHDLLQEHTFLLVGLARLSLTSSPAYNASLAALQNNINEVGTLLTPIYGINASQLVSLWNQKTNIFINYTISLRNNDPNANTYYNAGAAIYLPQVVTFWTSTNNPYPVLNQQIAQQLTTQHLADVKATIDDWNAGNYPKYYSDLEVSYNEMGVYADVIANAIIQQNPNNFP
jgi:hypothetical protein